MEKSETFETGCCPRFKPESWQEKEVRFDDKLFLKDHIRSLFHIPVNFGQVMKRDMAQIEKAGASASEQLVLNDETSAWGSDVYIAVDKEIPGAEMERLSGTFLCKSFEGPYKDVSKFAEEMNQYVHSKGKEVKRLLFYYAYCPQCAKAYGKNYTVILAEV